jgi:hypothetical protein
MMETTRNVGDDLGYVREVVARAEGDGTPRAIWYLWAVIGAVGFTLIDFAPERVGLYWSVAAPLGFLASAWLGWRHARAAGQVSRREGWSHVLHWGGMMAGIFLVVPLAASGAIPEPALPRVMLLVLALGYFLGGVHLHRPLLWIGVLMAGAYGALFFLDRYAWSLVGAVLALSLIATAHLSRHGGRG